MLGWWATMAACGLILGAVAAYSTGAWRVLLKTLAVPALLVGARISTPGMYPHKNQPLYLMADLLIVAVTGVLADYLVGMALGRNGRDGYRHDSVGH